MSISETKQAAQASLGGGAAAAAARPQRRPRRRRRLLRSPCPPRAAGAAAAAAQRAAAAGEPGDSRCWGKSRSEAKACNSCTRTHTTHTHSPPARSHSAGTRAPRHAHTHAHTLAHTQRHGGEKPVNNFAAIFLNTGRHHQAASSSSSSAEGRGGIGTGPS